MTHDVSRLGAVTAGNHLHARRGGSLELTDHLLARIERVDGRLHSFVHVAAEQARAQARQADRELASGQRRSPLHGVPIALKDLVFTRDMPTRCGMDPGHAWPTDIEATIVTRLRQVGAVILGKLTMTEGAFGGYHPTVPEPVNPWQADAWTGHSSSGAGVATAAGLCFAAVGTDTGGSIRFPAAANGLYGLKPTWGRISVAGVFPMSPALDHVGPLARTVIDLAAMMDAMAGWDRSDPTSLPEPAPSHLSRLAPRAAGRRVGVDPAAIDGVAPEIRLAFDQALALLAEAGCQIVETTFPDLRQVAANWLALCSPDVAVVHEAFFEHEPGRYGPVLRALIEHGQGLTGRDVVRADRSRRRFAGQVDALLRSVDALLLPVQPMSPPNPATLRARTDLGSGLDEALRYTGPFNLSGHPALSMPAILTDAGAPVGVQLVGARSAEQTLLDLAAAYERVRGNGGGWPFA